MRLHRFYVSPKTQLTHYLWINDERLVNQWLKVLRFRTGQEVVLFDGEQHERLYVITKLEDKAVHVELVTDLVPKTPKREVYLFWALLKKDNNDHVLQKCTELGVRHFVPLLAERSVKTGFDVERASRIVIEAAEQCGRFDIPKVREPLLLQTALHEFAGKLPLYVCEQSEDEAKQKLPAYDQVGVFVGPEGGWSDAEKQLFSLQEVPKLYLGDFTLRAETAAITAATKLIQ